MHTSSVTTEINRLIWLLIDGQSCDFNKYLTVVDDVNNQLVAILAEEYKSEWHAKSLLLKLSNLAVGKYEFKARHERLVARPFGLIVDPCNSCQLECPGCLHASKEVSNSVDWSSGNLKKDVFGSLLEEYGPYVITTRFFNWGEPLLNKWTPEFVALARTYFHRTSISTNLSLPFDVEALVESGLDYLIMSVDGATQSTYEKYRKKGKINTVFENMSKLVEAKKKLGSKTPHLQWQYLLFNHTLHETELALHIANTIGIDEVNFTNAYDVSATDPAITIPADPPMRRHVLTPPGPGISQSRRNIPPILSKGAIDFHFNKGWASRYDEITTNEFSRLDERTCQWLYKNLVMEANGRILPCCYLLGATGYFAEISMSDPFNSPKYLMAREYFTRRHLSSSIPCQGCMSVNSLPNVNNLQIPFYFTFIDSAGLIDRSLIKHLADW